MFYNKMVMYDKVHINDFLGEKNIYYFSYTGFKKVNWFKLRVHHTMKELVGYQSSGNIGKY